MDLKFRCPGCGAKLAAEDDLIAQNVPCPRCQRPVVVPKPSLVSGQMIGGFRIDHLLGYGSMGEVFLATQVSMDRPVALKVLPRELTDDQENVDFFKNEVRTLARLDHPNIVGAFEAGEHQGMHYLAMTYVDGESLAEKIERDGPYDEREALRITIKVARALEYAWDKFKLLHRDVKPANIMIDTYGDVKLMDLGLATNFSGEEAAAQRFAFGTPDYMGPEQIRALPNLDFRTDIYALGCTLFNLLAGETPYVGGDAQEVVKQQLEAPIPSICDRKSNVSRGTDALIREMMAKSPDERPNSWAALIHDLRRCLKGADSSDHSNSAGGSNKMKLHGATDFSRPVVVETPSAKWPLVLAFVLGLMVIGGVTWFGLQWVDQQGVQVDVPPPDPPLEDPPTEPPKEDPPKVEQVDVEPPKPAVDSFELANRMTAAEAYDAEHPQDIDGAIRRYQDVLDMKSGLPVDDRAREAISRLEERRKAEIATVLADLQRQSVLLVNDLQFEEAVTLYKEYDGPYAAETARERTAAANLLNRRRLQHEQQKSRQEDMADAALASFADGLATALLTGENAKLAELIDSVATSPDLKQRRTEAKAVADQALATARYRTRIAASLLALAGREEPIPIQLATETVKVQISGLEGTRVKGKKLVKIGNTEGLIGATFALDDLSTDEKLRQVTTDKEPLTYLMRGLICEHGGRTDEARNEFTAAGKGLLPEALLRRLAALYPAPAAPNGFDDIAPVDPTAPIDLSDVTLPSPDSVVLWLRADKGVETGRRGEVRRWLDQSGRDHHANAESARFRPTLVANVVNNQPVVEFDGEQTYLRIGDNLIHRATGATAFFVLNLVGDPLDDRVRPFGSAGTESDRNRAMFRLDFWGIGQAGVPSFSISKPGSNPGGQFVSAAGPGVRSKGKGPMILSVGLESRSVVLRDNGTAGVANRTDWQNERIDSDTDKYVGASNEQGRPGGYFRGGIAEIIIYNRCLSHDEVLRIEAYLSRKYALPVDLR